MIQILGVANLKFTTINSVNYPQIATIYNEGLTTNMATFETKVPDWDSWNLKYHPFCRIALEDENKILAWATLSKVSERTVYKGVAEVSIYVKNTARGNGFGKKILLKLISESEKNGIWSLQASIFRQNKASFYIHEKCGFRRIGYKEKIAKLHGVWQDNIILEKRSKIL